MEYVEEILHKRSNPALLVLNLQGELLFFNERIKEILPSITLLPAHSSKENPFWHSSLIQLIEEMQKNLRLPYYPEIYNRCFSGSLRKADNSYTLRGFFIGNGLNKNKPSHILILVEPIVQNRLKESEKIMTAFKLSKREVEVVKLVLDGLSNKEISKKLFISEYTTKDHIKHIMQKLNKTSRSQIAAIFLSHSR